VYLKVYSNLTKASLLVLDGNVLASLLLELTANVIRDLLVFCLLNSALVVLWSLPEEFLLDEVDALVKVIFILLTLPTSTSGGVQLVADATKESTATARAGLLLMSGRVALRGVLALLVLAAAELACCAFEEVHCVYLGGVGVCVKVCFGDVGLRGWSGVCCGCVTGI